MRIADFEERYAPEVSRLILENIQTRTSLFYRPDEIEAMKTLFTPERIIEESKSGEMVLALSDGEVLGSGGLAPDAEKTGRIICAYVRFDRHGERIFYALTSAVVRRAHQKGYDELWGDAVRDPLVRDIYLRIGCEEGGEIFHPVNDLQIPYLRLRGKVPVLKKNLNLTD